MAKVTTNPNVLDAELYRTQCGEAGLVVSQSDGTFFLVQAFPGAQQQCSTCPYRTEECYRIQSEAMYVQLVCGWDEAYELLESFGF